VRSLFLNRQLRFARFDPSPDRAERIAVSLALAAITGAFYWGGSSSPSYYSDLDQVWHASRALFHGQDPYSVVGRGLDADQVFPLYYPLPALVAFLPFTALPLAIARTLFVAVSAGLLAYAVTWDGWHRLPLFLSGAYLGALMTAQWSPLLTAAFLLPWLAPVLTLKPNLGLAIAASSPARGLLTRAVLGGGALLLVSLILEPQWPLRWLALIRGAPHFTPPVLLPGGFLVLLALLRWRRPEARLLVAMACVPHTTFPYETLPIMLVARSWKESLLLAGLSMLTLFGQIHLVDRDLLRGPQGLSAFSDFAGIIGTFLVTLVYIPATILVLRRPNNGDLPGWLISAGSFIMRRPVQ
jgi:hypothetical protein